MTVIRGSCVAFYQQGLLLRGESGAGKSDLALRLLDAGAVLVADDYVAVEPADGGLNAKAPEAIRGLLEVRGLGILSGFETATARLVAVVDLVAPANVDRHPEPGQTQILGVPLPCFRFAPFEASAAAKVRVAVALATGKLKRSP